MIPLQLHLLAHPKSEPSRQLADALTRRFVDPPASGGLRVPVRLTPVRKDGSPPKWDGDDGVVLDGAEHTIVVVLSDSVMVQTVDGGKGKQWKKFLKEGIQKAPVGDSPHYVICVAAGESGFAIHDKRNLLRVGEPPRKQQTKAGFEKEIQKWIDKEIDLLALQITLRAIQLLDPQVVEAPDKEPLRLFLSHAKVNLSEKDDHPLRAVQKAIRDLPVKGWFDAARIAPTADFEDVIQGGIRDCSIVVSFLTDDYASRSWCQREILDAKRFGVPVIVAVSLEAGEQRSFPYLGNVPTIQCRADDMDEMARQIVCQSARETLRAMHNRARIKQGNKREVVLATAPEAASIAWLKATRFVYPDPPITRDEIGLLKRLRPDAEFSTPLTKLAKRGVPKGWTAMAVSIGNSDELDRYGFSKELEKTLMDELHLYLLMAGLQIAYGGALKGDFGKGHNNFTVLLFDLVSGYSDLASKAGAKSLRPILNYPPWPLHLDYGQSEIDLFGTHADLIRGAAPDSSEVPETPDELFPIPKDEEDFRFVSGTPEQRLAWTRGLTAMRAQITDETATKLAVGGKLNHYAGMYPGIVEEAWMSLVRRKPLFLVGAIGGAAHAVIEALKGNDEALRRTMANVPDLKAILALAESRYVTIDESVKTSRTQLHGKGYMVHPDAMAAEITARAEVGLQKALNNGLSDDQNRELFYSAHPPRIAELILTGLSRLGSSRRRPRVKRR